MTSTSSHRIAPHDECTAVLDSLETNPEEVLESFKCQMCDYVSNLEANFHIHKQIESKLEQLRSESRKLLEGVEKEELVLTADELATFKLDWRDMDELGNLLRKMSN